MLSYFLNLHFFLTLLILPITKKIVVFLILPNYYCKYFTLKMSQPLYII